MVKQCSKNLLSKQCTGAHLRSFDDENYETEFRCRLDIHRIQQTTCFFLFPDLKKKLGWKLFIMNCQHRYLQITYSILSVPSDILHSGRTKKSWRNSEKKSKKKDFFENLPKRVCSIRVFADDSLNHPRTMKNGVIEHGMTFTELKFNDYLNFFFFMFFLSLPQKESFWYSVSDF